MQTKLPTADLAPTGRARCMGCLQAIPKGSVRIAVPREDGAGSGYGGPVPGYLHPACAAPWSEAHWPAGPEDLLTRVRAHTALPALPPPFDAESAGLREQAEAAKAAQVPAFGSLPQAKVVSLAKKLRSTPDFHKATRLVEKAGLPWGQIDLFRWHIAQHGLVPPTHEGMLRGLAEAVDRADTEAIFAVLPLLGPSRASELLPAWPWDADRIVYGAHTRDPERLAALAAGAPPALRRGIGLVRGRLGLPVPEEDRAAIRAGLAEVESTLYGLPRSYAADGERLHLHMPEGDRTLRDGGALAAFFGSDADWDAALAKQATRAAFRSVERVERGLAALPLEDFVACLGKASLSSDRPLEAALSRVCAARADDPAALGVLARALPTNSPARELLLYHAIGAFSPETLPAGLEAEPRWRDPGYALAPWRDRPELAALGLRAARAMGRARGLALVDLLLEREWDRTCVVLLLGVYPDEARTEKAVASGGISADAAVALGTPALPLLARLCDADAPHRDTLARDLLAILGAEGLAGRSFEAVYDRFVGVLPDLDYLGEGELSVLRGALRGMDSARRVATLDRLLAEGKRPERVYVMAQEEPALRARAATALAARFAAVRDTSPVRAALRNLGPAALEDFREALAQPDAPPKLFELLAEFYGKSTLDALREQAGIQEETKVERLLRLAGAAAGPTLRIYLLERPGGDPALPPRPATSRTVSGGEGPAGGPGEPFEHVLTLDLAELPELAARHPESALLALFAPDPEGGEDWERARLIALPASPAPGGSPLQVLPVTVPRAVFDPSAARADPALEELRGLIFNRPGWILGRPMFIQDDAGDGPDFVMQLSEGVGSLNLGDSGSLYVFESGSFMQCY